MILSEEGDSSMGDCYQSNYHLSDQYLLSKYSNMSDIPYYNGIHPDSGYPLFFNGHTLLNWAIFSMPRHPFLKATLINIVDVIKSEYKQKSILMITKWDVKFKHVLCTTNFILTYTLRKMLIDKLLSSKEIPRVCTHDFRQYKGKAKAVWTGGDPTHYRKVRSNQSSFHKPVDADFIFVLLLFEPYR
jgi:hypothetical protein